MEGRIKRDRVPERSGQPQPPTIPRPSPPTGHLRPSNRNSVSSFSTPGTDLVHRGRGGFRTPAQVVQAAVLSQLEVYGLDYPGCEAGVRFHGQRVPAGRWAAPVGVDPRRAMRRRLPLRHMNPALGNAQTANSSRPTVLTIDGTKPSLLLTFSYVLCCHST